MVLYDIRWLSYYQVSAPNRHYINDNITNISYYDITDSIRYHITIILPSLCSITPLHLWYHLHLISCYMLSHDITDSIWYHITIILPSLCSIPPLHLWYHLHPIPCHMLSYDSTDNIWYNMTNILPGLCSIPPLHQWYH